MRILLIEPMPSSPVEKAVLGMARTEPLALELVAAGVDPRHEVRLLDLRVEPEALDAVLLEFRPDLAAAGACTASFRAALRVLARAKEACGALTAIGGHHPTLVPGDLAGTGVDFSVLGEAELAFPALVESIDAGRRGAGVPGTARFPEGRMELAPPRPLADLDALPVARRSLRTRYEGNYFRGRWRPVASAYTSRGCPFRCRFCAMWKLYAGAYRLRSPARVAEEVAALAEPYVDFADDNTLQDPAQSEALARALLARAPGKTFKVYARADAVVRRPDLVSLWREAGLGLALVGFEAFRESDLKRVRKGVSLDANEKAIEILKDRGIEIAAYFLVHPDFDGGDFRALSEYVESRGLRQPVFTVLTPFPGTDYYDEVRAELITDDTDRFDLMHSVLPTRLPPEEFHREFAGLYRRAYGPGGPAEGGLPAAALDALVGEEAWES